jgi:hypothetical protein
MWDEEEIQEKFMKLLPKETSNGSSKEKKSKMTDPNKPKRGKSAYLFFCLDNREKIKQELGKEATATSVTAKLGKVWNDMKDNAEKDEEIAAKIAVYEKEAQEDKERYNSEMTEYSPPSDEELISKKKSDKKIKKKMQDPNRPKRGKSAYLFYCIAKRDIVKKEMGESAKPTDVSIELGDRWKILNKSNDPKAKKELAGYEREAKEDKERYDSELSVYVPREITVEQKPLKEKKTKKVVSDKIVKADIDEPSDIFEIEVNEAEKENDDSDIFGDTENEEEKPVEKVKKVKEKSGVKKAADKKKVESEVENKKDKLKPSGYQFFCKENRASVKNENPGMDAQNITRILAGNWKNMPKKEQEEWTSRARE